MDELTIDIGSAQSPLPDLYDSLKSPDRTKSWKGSRLRRSKTYSGSPNNRLGNENTPAIANKHVTQDEKPVPLSPVNQRKWNKTKMKRRSTITTAKDKLNKSDRRDSRLITSDCYSGSTTKVEVRHSSDISPNAVIHRYSCHCKQYLDESSGIMYRLQELQSFDSNLLCTIGEKCIDDTEVLSPLDILHSSIMEEEAHMLRSSTPVATYAENTRAEHIPDTKEFNFDFYTLDDTIIELQDIRTDLNTSRVNEVWSDSYHLGCCNQKSVDKLKIPTTVLESMSSQDSSNVVYLLISVFSYLDLASILEAGAVCRTWHCASQHPAIWREVTIQNKTFTLQALYNLAISCISTQQLRIKNCQIIHSESVRDELKNWCTSMSGCLRTLHLSDNNDSNMLLDEVVIHCTNLTQLHCDSKMTDSHIDSISNNLTSLTCLNIGNTRGLNSMQFYEMEAVKCLTFNASGLRVDEVASIVEWFPNLSNLHITHCTSLHSIHAKSVFGSSEKLLNLNLTDTYVTPRALLFILCSTCREVKSLNVTYTSSFTTDKTFEDKYRSDIKFITSNKLFKDIVTVTFHGPQKPPRLSQTPPCPDVS